MVESIHRPSKVKVNLSAITYNIEQEMKRRQDGQDIYAVVKANAYGHGAIEVAKTAMNAGAIGLCVSNLDEALELRHAGILAPILVLSHVSADYFTLALEQHITLTIPSIDWLQELCHFLEEHPDKTAVVHLKVDSGMGRIGLRTTEEFDQCTKLVTTHPNLTLEGIFTHFATADSVSTEHFEEQQQRFVTALEHLPTEVRYIHTANSATALWHNAWKSNLVRFGDAMYGMNPSGHELRLPYDIKQALSLETELIHVKEVEPGEKIGYGATYESDSQEWIGTLPIGYADGLLRRFQGYHVIIEGIKVPIVGRVCMDQCMIRLPRRFKPGTKVTIFGENNGAFNSVQSGADYIETINYEVTCALSSRLARTYVYDGDQ